MKTDRNGGVSSSQPPLQLLPGLCQKLITELDGAGVALKHRASHLSDMTGRASQTTRRWVDEQQPGLPDLESFASLCQHLDADANYLLGFLPNRFPLPVSKIEEASSSKEDGWIPHIFSVLSDVIGLHIETMRGDDMSPRFNDGDVVFVDTECTSFRGNGLYLVEYVGHRLIRTVESRVGQGLVLRCANPDYGDTFIGEDSPHFDKLLILGRVRAAIALRRF